MAKNQSNQKKLEFKGVFGVDGVAGGDTYPYWEVDEDTYKRIMKEQGVKEPDVEKLSNGKVKLYANQLFDNNKEGAKQKFKLIIEE